MSSVEDALGVLSQRCGSGLVEHYDSSPETGLIRMLARRDKSVSVSTLEASGGLDADGDAYSVYWGAWLRGQRPPEAVDAGQVRTVDLFAGCGGLTLGVEEACRAVGLATRCALAVDVNEQAMAVFEANLSPERSHLGRIEDLVDGDLGEPTTPRESGLVKELGLVTMVVGGPPCQGHSDLNNHTRRRDPKNALYLRMARFVEVIGPEHVIIENVPGVVHDRGFVVSRTRALLADIGYAVSDGVVSVDRLGWPQRRRRHILIASRATRDLDVSGIEERYGRAALPVGWALREPPDGEGVLHTPASHSHTNRARISYLFQNDLYELPDDQRPDCHRLRAHTYRSVYGRMRLDKPAPTITSGFGSTGQGRFVHPWAPRTLTPREAARVQGFPDWFDFSMISRRGALQEMIGNAVPSRLSFVAALELLR